MKKLFVFLIAFFLLFSTMPVYAATATKNVVTKPAATTTKAVTTTKPAATTIKPIAGNYGLIPNDASQKDNNASLLNRALNQYGSITLNGVFYIGNTSEAVTNPNIAITGMNASELIFNNGKNTVLFDPEKIKSLTISNMKFTNLSKVNALLIAYNPAENSSSKVNSVKVDGCTFEGDISLYRQQGNKNLNPVGVDFGIDQFIFTNNSVSNTTYSFIVLSDIPFRNVEIRNNTIHNFQNVFASMSITNGITYEAQMVEARKFVGIYNNKVTCDDNWWAEAGGGEYYAFALTENKEVVYDSNRVEGMKANFDVALYDAYLSSGMVTYTNNTWINNICFDANKTNNALIKAKQGGVGGDAGNSVPVNRVYSNNTFIVEESYADRLGQPKSELFVSFMELTTCANNFTIENNKIDVYDLRFPGSSQQITNFKFNNNEIKSKYALGNITILRLTDNCQPIIEMTNNNIQIEQKDAHPSGITRGLQLLQIVDVRTNTSKGLAKSIVVKDNIIHGPFDYIFFTLLADALVVQNNQISVASALYQKPYYLGNHPELANILVSKY